ncbi:hypothetical protein [Plastoroseomonas arctica]|uniref:AbrB/MazE/SpoVT family DNA-binding domain-containing protein n=1 Tax=Plastoroseomonas arctica TaxID=1509237 RepID=A0AAF1K5F0_9PROT|nr:hypothetical protein [Plastoroseomonas arctica]MBR0656334.1 AbrB/MazE/SpoVT family DNA-binding domain-containing protein [Plastoroseomonas arctica]
MIGEDGGELQLSIVDGELRAMTPKAARMAIQQHVGTLEPPGLSMVDELIAYRRAEAKHEWAIDRPVAAG